MSNMIFFFSGMPRRQSRLVDLISLTLSLRHNLIARPYRIAHCQSGDEWPPAAPGGRLAPGVSGPGGPGPPGHHRDNVVVTPCAAVLE